MNSSISSTIFNRDIADQKRWSTSPIKILSQFRRVRSNRTRVRPIGPTLPSGKAVTPRTSTRTQARTNHSKGAKRATVAQEASQTSNNCSTTQVIGNSSEGHPIISTQQLRPQAQQPRQPHRPGLRITTVTTARRKSKRATDGVESEPCPRTSAKHRPSPAARTWSWRLSRSRIRLKVKGL